MRAAIWQGPGEMSLGDVPEPACPEDGVLLRTVACGICGTDVRSFYNGDRRISAPWVLGHEITGEIVEIGDRVEPGFAHAPGDLVHCISTLYDGVCRLCRGGHEHLCVNGELMGFDHQGAYAELVAIPEIALKNLFAVPDGLSAEDSTFADPLSDAICGHKDLAIGNGDTVLVIGAGPVGVAHAILARAEGASRVVIAEHAEKRLSLAESVLGSGGADYVETANGDAVGALLGAVGEDGADVVIVACSSDLAQEQAMEVAAPRGRVLFFGGLPKGTNHIRFPSNILHYKEVQVHGSYASRRADQIEALEMLASDSGGVRKLISETVSLEEAPGAFPRIRAGEVLKVVVKP